MTDLVNLRLEQRDDVVVASLSGELDVAGAPTIGDSIADAVPNEALGVVVDCSALEFIDSSGVAMLFGLARRLGSRRQGLRVVAPDRGPVARVLAIVDFGKAAPIDESLEAALAGIAR